ncbi:UNVERIFIED_CONTAM: hypothetical protein FKN15_017956 [Acipenser sinensis]
MNSGGEEGRSSGQKEEDIMGMFCTKEFIELVAWKERMRKGRLSEQEWRRYEEERQRILFFARRKSEEVSKKASKKQAGRQAGQCTQKALRSWEEEDERSGKAETELFSGARSPRSQGGSSSSSSSKAPLCRD